ncbi:MAG: hypothetical protein QOG15_769 [Solirubrobacteraceae bacterium]|jgi:hypothetical protein|nr:hypothetical protein [Solirubrobacteraceae bacterium]
MRRKVPSPSMVIALIALAVALSGTAVAAVAVDFARNAGAVDHKSAVPANSSTSHAAGKLVATAKHGSGKGRLPGRFVNDVMRGSSVNLTRYLRVVDNQPGPVVPMAIIGGIGRLDAQCRDQDPTVGVESTQTLITFTASNPGGVNVSRLLGRDIDRAQDGVVFSALPSQPVPVINFADSLFQLILQARNKTVLVMGSSRSDSNKSANAACLIWGVSLRVG